MIITPIEKTDSEWRARVRQPAEFQWLKQIWPAKNGNSNYPYNSKGIRSIGGALKSDPDKVTDQSIRFSRKTKFKWTEPKIRAWIKSHGYSLKALDKLKSGKMLEYYKEQKPIKFRFITPEFEVRSYEKGKPLIIEGIINSSSIDSYNEIVSPDAVMKSVEFYKKYPTVRWMHGPIPIGKTLKIWRDGDFVKAKIEIDADEEKVISKILKGTVKAFSIGFMALSWDRYCPNKDLCVRRFTDILLIEISPVDSPANRDAQMTDISWKSPVNTEDYYFENEEGKLESLDLSEGDFRTTHLCEEPEEIRADKKFNCECIECGYKMKSDKHCRDIKCPKCGGEMRRAEKPGPGKSISESMKSKRGNEMPEEEIEVLAAVDEEEVPVEEPKPEPTEEKKPDTEAKPQESEGTEKILEAIKALATKVDTNSKELERMKMTEDERKVAEEMDTKIQKEVDAYNVKVAELEKEKAELQKKLEIRDEVEKQLVEKEKQLPPVRSSMSINNQPTKVADEIPEADIEATKTISKYLV